MVLSLDGFIVSSQLCFTSKKTFIASLPQQAAIFNGIILPYPTFRLHNLRNLKKRGLIVRFLGAIFRSHSKNRAESRVESSSACRIGLLWAKAFSLTSLRGEGQIPCSFNPHRHYFTFSPKALYEGILFFIFLKSLSLWLSKVSVKSVQF